MNQYSRCFLFLLSLLSVATLAACSGIKSEAKYPTGLNRTTTGGDIYAQPQSIFGKDGLTFFGGKQAQEEDNGIGVNSYLWRASLDTVSFMPLDQADPFGGVITTGWFTPSNTPNERVKANVLILSKSLKSDGIRVKLFRQASQGSTWKDMPVSTQTERELEDAILTRARQLRVGDL
jgi:hypothetical protein